MAVKEILVHVNISRHCRGRLDIAVRLAKQFDAHLTGLYTSAAGDVPFFMMEEIEARSEPTMRAWWLMKRDRAKADFDAAMRAAGVVADWTEIDDHAGSLVPYHASFADLTIVGQIDPEELLPRPEYDIPERAALESGRPVLVVPYAGSFPTIGQRVLIAWNGSSQAARAVQDALPFLKAAKHAVVATIGPEAGGPEAEADRGGLVSASRVVGYLARHGVTATARHVPGDDIAVGEALLSLACDETADLIVMGAYGHTKTREAILGGATRALFKRMTVPVLMSH